MNIDSPEEHRTSMIPFALRPAAFAAIGALALTGAVPAQAEPVRLNPADIISAEDYPEDLQKRGEGGRTIYTLTLGSDGRATACTIDQTSGHDVLDEITCRRLMEKAQFSLPEAAAESAPLTYTDEVTWALPLSEPRALLFGVTAQAEPSAWDPEQTKCLYSDGQWRIVPAGSSCGRTLPTFSVLRDGKPSTANIFEQYLFEADQQEKPEAIFNLGVLLLDNDYKQGVAYLEKASASGNAIASATLCSVYSLPEFWNLVEIDPNKALGFCNLALEQHYLPHVVTLAGLILTEFADEIDPEIARKATTAMVIKEHSADASLAIDGNQVIRSKDYPKKENARGVGGRTQAIIEILPGGRVGRCLIAESSYSYVLDQRVCERLREAGVYTPAVIDGAPAAQWTTQAVTWVPGGKRGLSPERILMQVMLGVVLGGAIF